MLQKFTAFQSTSLDFKSSSSPVAQCSHPRLHTFCIIWLHVFACFCHCIMIMILHSSMLPSPCGHMAELKQQVGKSHWQLSHSKSSYNTKSKPPAQSSPKARLNASQSCNTENPAPCCTARNQHIGKEYGILTTGAVLLHHLGASLQNQSAFNCIFWKKCGFCYIGRRLQGFQSQPPGTRHISTLISAFLDLSLSLGCRPLHVLTSFGVFMAVYVSLTALLPASSKTANALPSESHRQGAYISLRCSVRVTH